LHFAVPDRGTILHGDDETTAESVTNSYGRFPNGKRKPNERRSEALPVGSRVPNTDARATQ
jgi:hypothetical protein